MTRTEIEPLNSLLRIEIASVETYTQALEKIDDDKIASKLEACRASHLHRAEALGAKVMELGGTPAKSSGIWGAFAKLIERGAKLFGVKPAIEALEQGEDLGIRDYKSTLAKASPELRNYISGKLLPEQEKTHRMLSDLKHTLH